MAPRPRRFAFPIGSPPTSHSPLPQAPEPERVALVVPCYNEEARLDVAEFSRAVSAMRDLHIVFVDDGSVDGTHDLLCQLAARAGERVEILRLPANRGKAEAVRQGLLQAMRSTPVYVGFWDADLATPLTALDEFVDVFRSQPQCEWVIGSRVRLLGRRIERIGARHYAGRVFATAASLVLALPVYDTQCGAKVFRRSALLRECLDTPFGSRWIFDVELIARFCTAVRREGGNADDMIHELPLREWTDVGGSKVTLGAFARAALDLLRIYRTYPPRATVARARATARIDSPAGM